MSDQLPHHTRRHGIGPVLVFLHYWGGSARTWAPVISKLPERDVLTLDFRGWGRSRTLPGPYGLHQLASDTRAILGASGVSDYVLVGHSMGGKVAQLVAGAEPDGLRGIILIAPAPAVPAASVDAEHQTSLAHAYDSAESVARARNDVLTATELSVADKVQVVEDSLASTPDALVEWPLRGIAEDISADTRRIKVPALVVAGGNDVVEPAEVLRANLLPHLIRPDFTVVPDAGHLLPLEAPDAVAALISGFAPDSSLLTATSATAQ
ncbi:alpha/beta fold hydrolase [Spelaeicoccus albus]|uniref:Pimeloyl-ACP methyl ester carboxylesterase n=1 Tax=Spelaeicoccus albus TaxID=1280376 RepID=A0A7Z0A7K3_9MICO|nr:alpha/beta hydrolase [Spelaeicoccus albus]NYI65902.1 pimeloyl-ACP methyl ester carboxylesterase [Spelaeicoccus albus]